jgi:hypothetical protein
LIWLGVVLVLAVGLTFAILALPRHGRVFTETFRDEPSQVVVEDKPVPMTRARRRAVSGTLVRFVATAVTRKDPLAAWDLATRGMKAGTTRAQWARGELPVFPYPATPSQARGWTLVSSTKDDVIVDLVLQPPKHSKRGPVEFNVELKQVGAPANRRWLVHEFIPIRTYNPVDAKPKPVKPLPANYKPRYARGKLSPLWFLLPAFLLGLIILVPVSIGVVNWRRGVRAEREYRARRGP